MISRSAILILLRLIISAGAVSSLQWTTAALADEVPIPQATGQFFLPHLDNPSDAGSCSSLKDAARSRFLSREFSIDLRNFPNLLGYNTLWPVTDERTTIDRYRFDSGGKNISYTKATGLVGPVDAQGKHLMIIQVRGLFSDSFVYAVYVFSSEDDFREALDGISRNRYYQFNEDVAARAYSGFEEPAIILHDDRFFLMEDHRSGSSKTPDEIQITELTENGRGEVICSVRVEPEGLEQQVLPSLLKLMALLDKVVGKGGRCEGTLNPTARLRARFPALVSTSMLRPWVALEAYNSRENVDFYLTEWSKQSLAFKIQYEKLYLVLEEVVVDLTTYYQRTFGYSEHEAIVAAEKVADWILRAHFIFPGSDKTPDNMPESRYFRWLQDGDLGPDPGIKKLRRELRSLILEDMPVETIEDSVRAISAARSKEEIQLIFPIADSLERLGVLDLLIRAGGDVNQANIFGKTPLMVAAHQNLETAAAKLIETGADPNRKTKALYDYVCSVAIDVGDRTALFYAAENASLNLIRLLLENGADTNAIDTRGWTALDYLKLSKMTDEDRSKAALLIQSYMD